MPPASQSALPFPPPPAQTASEGSDAPPGWAHVPPAGCPRGESVADASTGSEEAAKVVGADDQGRCTQLDILLVDSVDS